MKKVYIAIPYTGMELSSYRQANLAAVMAMRMGYNPYSPISHSHPLTLHGAPGDWDFWHRIDTDWLEVCQELWVIVPREGAEWVHNSKGVMAEMNYAKSIDVPVRCFKINSNKLIEQ